MKYSSTIEVFAYRKLKSLYFTSIFLKKRRKEEKKKRKKGTDVLSKLRVKNRMREETVILTEN